MKTAKFHPTLEGSKISIQPGMPSNDGEMFPTIILFIIDDKVKASVSIENAKLLLTQMKNSVNALKSFRKQH